MENKEYQIPKKYPKPQTNQVELITTNFAHSYAKPLLYKSAFAANQKKSKRIEDNADNYQKAFGDTSEYLGQQIITTVKLTLPEYEDERFNVDTNRYQKVKVAGAEIILDTVLVEISSSKNIVETAINGMHGTIKEFISNGDYEVTIQGAMVSAGRGYPFEMVQTLQDILKAPVPIQVESEFLSLFSIYNLVVKSTAFPSREGYVNTQLFSFTALSDEPIELKL